MLFFEEERFPGSFFVPFFYSLLFEVMPARRSVSYSEMQREKIRGVEDGGDDGRRKSYFSWCKHSHKCPEFVSARHAGTSYYPGKCSLDVTPGLHICPLEQPLAQREREVGRGGMERVGKSFSLLRYQGNKQDKTISDGIIGEASPASCSGNDQCLHHIWTGRWKFPFRSTQTVSLQWKQEAGFS